MNYNLSPLELLQILGCEPSPDYRPDERLPQMLNDFLSRIFKQPLFRTADIWRNREPYFYYEEIMESIEEDADYWAAHPEEWRQSEYYPFAQLDQAEWPRLTPNYLKIGSDYAAGIVSFAILEADLQQADPAVYLHHEEDDVRTWQKFSDTLTGFLMYILCAVLSCETYDTAKDVLRAAGWTYTACPKPENLDRQYSFIFGLMAACGYDDETGAIFSLLEDNGCKAYLISR